MRRITQPSVDGKCLKCGGEIPPTKRSDASYCSVQCRNAAEKKRYKAKNPEYVKRQLGLVNVIRHIKIHGHTDYIDHPLLNKKDRFRVARSLGFRSLLEYTVHKQLTDLGFPFKYEAIKIEYIRPIDWKDGPDVD